MKRTLIFDSFVLEVVRYVDRDLSRRIGHNYSSNPVRERLVAVLLHLTEAGLISRQDRRRESWFYFGPDEDADDQPDEIDDIPGEILAELMENFGSFKMRGPELAASIKLSKKYGAHVDRGMVESSQRWVMGILESIIEGHARLIGPAAEGGLILEDITRSTADDLCLVWFSLCNETSKEPLMVDLQNGSFVEGQPLQISIKAAASSSGCGRTFVTLMPPG